MRQAKLGTVHSPETKRKIGESVSRSISGTPKSSEHRDRISESLTDYEGRCLTRFEELKSEYPEQAEFFEDNKSELLFALQDVRSENELRDLRDYIELSRVEAKLSYEYSSSSVYAAEDLMIALLDAKRGLQSLLKPA
jgi:hypothetical protein